MNLEAWRTIAPGVELKVVMMTVKQEPYCSTPPCA